MREKQTINREENTMINAKAYTAKMKKATMFNERRHPDVFDALNLTLTTDA